MNLKLLVAGICVLLVPEIPGMAQTAATGSVVAVEQAVPFGTIPGKLLLLDNYLVFVDEQQPGASFVVEKSVIETLNAEGPTITVHAKDPIRDRSGEVRRLTFRVVSGSDPVVVTSWYGSGAAIASAAAPAAPSAAPAAPSPAPAAGATTYPARHNHRIGDCRGRLIVAPDQLSYESVSSVGHSRRWEYRAIKEIKLPNPYELEIKPFTGGTYKLSLDGTGMDPAAYKELVDRVTSARAGR